MTAGRHPPASFFVAAFAVGVSFANTAVAVPLLALSFHGEAALAGGLLAVGTISIAFGAVVGGVVSRRAGGGARALVLALAVSGAGGVVLVLSVSVVLVALASAFVGLGVGIFWVASQLILGRRSGEPGSERGFLAHYAAYTFGAVLGSGATGGMAALGMHAGLAHLAAIRLSALFAIGAVSAALALWWPHAVRTEAAARPGQLSMAPVRHLAIQSSDLLLVSALGFLLPLTPVVLAKSYHLGTLTIGLLMAAVSLAKIVGTFAARALSRASGKRTAILLLLAGAAAFCSMLSLTPTAPVFVAALLVTALAGTGAWPLVVDSAQARVRPEARHGLTVLWNAREYGVIAAATACSGWLFGVFGTPVPLFVLAALLIAGAAVSSGAVLKRPVWHPDEQARMHA
jgi:MFS family permease